MSDSSSTSSKSRCLLTSELLSSFVLSSCWSVSGLNVLSAVLAWGGLRRRLEVLTMSRSMRRWVRRSVRSMSAVSPRCAAVRDSWRHCPAEEPESDVKGVPVVGELVAELVEFAPSHCKSVGELGAVEVVQRQLAAQ
eukprot:8848086-Pyramimonas_sp.AAC.1